MNTHSALIAMSGGVDSSVAACRMVQAGWHCEGTTMRLYHSRSVGRSSFHTCCSEEDIRDAAEVAFQLDIPYSVTDYTEDFSEKIIEKFIRVYEQGGTPNPCIDCNRYMKFDKLLAEANSRGLYYIVTGHYARIRRDEATGRYLLCKAADLSKDQSYVLYNLTQSQLAHTLFPLGEMTKEETRQIAEAQGFGNARKHDSQDICFVPDGDYTAFIEGYTGLRCPAGDILDESGRVLGRHRGAVRYTIGQRKGLGLALTHPVFVLRKDMANNTVTVGSAEALYTKTVFVEDCNWFLFEALTRPVRVEARTRYRQREAAAVAYPCGEGRIRLEFEEPQRAVTVGQAAVLYQGELVVGGGTVTGAE